MFKESFKYYKSKNPPPNLDHVLDFNDVEKIKSKIKPIEIDTTLKPQCIYGLKSVDTWEIYEIINHPGLIFIKNPFTSTGQRFWTARALRDYTKRPNKSNLDALNLVPEGKDWWDACKNSNLLIDKLRWVTLGYHHNWDTKVYSEDSKSDFPNDLGLMSRFIVETLGFQNFNAEAAIVNFYHMDSALSGHADYSEPNYEAPLISFSFGQTAIFLLGGKSKEEEPRAMFLRSGDIIIMSKESRLCFHGVPKILQMDSRFWDNFDEKLTKSCREEFKGLLKVCQDEETWKPFGDYLNRSRININVRQVLKRGQKRLCSDPEETTT